MKILITGGASGLGASITTKLASKKDNFVYFTYNSSHETAKKIESEFANTLGIKCNFKDSDDITNLVSKLKEFGIDALVNNAFATKILNKHFHKTDYQEFVDSFVFNIIPGIRITQEAIIIFRKKKFGKIITILSSALLNKPPLGYSEYVASKAYMESLSKSWATENMNFNITSNSISPSFMQTKLTEDVDERVIENIMNAHPLKKLLSTDEVANAVQFFLTASQQINGVNLVINAASDIA